MSASECRQARALLGTIAGRDISSLPVRPTPMQLRVALLQQETTGEFLHEYTVASVRATRRNDCLHLRLSGELYGLPSALDSDAPKFDLEITDGCGGDLRSAVLILERVWSRTAGPAVVNGYATSAHAALFSLWPGRRLIRDGARLMFHGPRFAFFGCAGEVERLLRQARDLERRICHMLWARAGRTKECARVLKRIEQGQDVWINAGEALTAGLADELIQAESPESRVDSDDAAPVATRVAPPPECPYTVSGCPAGESQAATEGEPSRPEPAGQDRAPG